VPPKPGELVSLRVRPEHLHWFDSASGQRLG
jgi:sn-glycerol 3-phosphate transport system ATP-binding protein